MYKYIGVIVLSIMMATSAQAGKWNDNNCTNRGGTILKANEYDPNDSSKDKGGYCASNPTKCNGMDFCMSNKAMNWWSAITWCEAHGGKLASMESLCPNTVLVSQENVTACSNLAWTFGTEVIQRLHSRTIQGLGAGENWVIKGNGGIFRHNRKGEDHRAICE